MPVTTLGTHTPRWFVFREWRRHTKCNCIPLVKRLQRVLKLVFVKEDQQICEETMLLGAKQLHFDIVDIVKGERKQIPESNTNNETNSAKFLIDVMAHLDRPSSDDARSCSACTSRPNSSGVLMGSKSGSLPGHTASQSRSSTRWGLTAEPSLVSAASRPLPPASELFRCDVLLHRRPFSLSWGVLVPVGEEATTVSAGIGHDTLAYHAQNMSIVITPPRPSAFPPPSSPACDLQWCKFACEMWPLLLTRTQHEANHTGASGVRVQKAATWHVFYLECVFT